MGQGKRHDASFSESKKRRLRDSGEVYRLKQRIANLEMTIAKTERIKQETKARNFKLQPSLDATLRLNGLAEELREIAAILLAN